MGPILVIFREQVEANLLGYDSKAREEGFYAHVFGLYRIVLRTLLRKASTAGTQRKVYGITAQH